MRAPRPSISSLLAGGPPALLPGDTRGAYDHVFSIYAPIAAGVFAATVVAILAAVALGRRRAPGRATRRHENNPLEIGYAVGLTLVVAFLLAVTYHFENQEDAQGATARARMAIDVTGSKWEWTFRYPGLSITRRSGAVGRQTLVVPAETPILFRLSSVDVIHSLWVPELRFKRDLLPGHVNVVVLRFPRTGSFGGSCAEFCGLLHADMDFTVQVVSRAAFAAWARGARA